MAFASHVDIPRVVTSQTSPMATPKVVYPNGGQLSGVRCCETGRPVALDPVTGSTVCSCQMKTGIPAYLSRVPSLPETVYGSGSGHLFQPNGMMGAEATAAFYHMGLKAAERQTEGGVKAGPHGVTSPYYLDQIMAAQTYNAFYSGLDINSARRKNATRETTSALKAWLYEHRKNPYPTKGEKIMLAIITRMTLTQVSTWFANARRRLKKENRLDGKDDDDLSDIEIDDIPMTKTSTSTCSELSPRNHNDGDRRSPNGADDLSDISDDEDVIRRRLPTKACYTPLYSPEQRTNAVSDTDLSPVDRNNSGPRHVSKYVNCTLQNRGDDVTIQKKSCDNSSSGSGNVPSKPKIWSISEIISNPKEDSSSPK